MRRDHAFFAGGTLASRRDRFRPAFGEKQRAQARTDFVLAADLERVDGDAIHVTDNPNTHSGLGGACEGVLRTFDASP